MSRSSQLLLVVLVAAALFFLMAKLRYTGKPPVKLQSGDCDPSLWQHVYERERLQVVEECTAVEGRVMSTHKSEDGDLHIGLDPDQKSSMNLVNVMHADRTLVVEIVCDHPPDNAAAAAACGTYVPQISIPGIGDRIRVTGAYVVDRENGWNEIHPVSRIEILR